MVMGEKPEMIGSPIVTHQVTRMQFPGENSGVIWVVSHAWHAGVGRWRWRHLRLGSVQNWVEADGSWEPRLLRQPHLTASISHTHTLHFILLKAFLSYSRLWAWTQNGLAIAMATWGKTLSPAQTPWWCSGHPETEGDMLRITASWQPSQWSLPKFTLPMPLQILNTWFNMIVR